MVRVIAVLAALLGLMSWLFIGEVKSAAKKDNVISQQQTELEQKSTELKAKDAQIANLNDVIDQWQKNTSAHNAHGQQGKTTVQKLGDTNVEVGKFLDTPVPPALLSELRNY